MQGAGDDAVPPADRARPASDEPRANGDSAVAGVDGTAGRRLDRGAAVPSSTVAAADTVARDRGAAVPSSTVAAADTVARERRSVAPSTAAPRWRGAARAALPLLLLAGLCLAALSLADQWAAVRRGAGELSPGFVAAAGLAVLLSLTFSLLSWRSTLAGVGAPLPLAVAGKIYFVGQLGKYVPGSVWPVVAQMELGAAHGLARTSVGTASLLTMAISVPVALLLGLLAVPALLSADASAYLLLFLVLPLGAVVLSPPVLNPLLSRALRLVRRGPLPQRLGGAAVARVALFAAAAHLLLGVQAWALARDLGADGALVLPLAIGAFSLANVTGLLALPLPAGAGVREAVLVAALSPVLPLGQALVLALVSRLLLTAGDLAVALAAARRLRSPRPKTDMDRERDRSALPSS